MSTASLKVAKLGLALAAVAAAHATGPTIETLLLVGGFVSAVLVWVALQVRDYKPNRRLRADNRELLAENGDQLRRLDEKSARIKELEQSRDFDTSFAVVLKELAEARERAASEHRAILEEIAESRKHQYEAWATFHQQIGSLTSAIQVVASGMLSEAQSAAPSAPTPPKT